MGICLHLTTSTFHYVFSYEHARRALPYPKALLERYKGEAPTGTPGWELIEMAGRKRGYLVSGGEVNTERMSKVLLDEFRSGKLGKFTLEMPEEVTQ